ncbi:MAG TPA: hypothetical protein VJT32_07800 [bacterium]|nr:hypothetical protein [bacterium]
MVHLESGETVVILEGKVVEVTDPSLFTQFAEAYRAKYQWRLDDDSPDRIVYALHPHVAFTWLERDYRTAIRWRFDCP